jgi:hypothetical protein
MPRCGIITQYALWRAVRDEIGEGFAVREDRSELDVTEERSVFDRRRNGVGTDALRLHTRCRNQGKKKTHEHLV